MFVRGALVAPQGRIPRPIRSAYVAPYRSPERRAAIADFVADIPTTPSHPSHAALAGVASRLPELDAPVLLAWGERDPVFHLEFAADLRQRLPRAQLHRVPLAGHLVVEEEDVAALADAWLERLDAPVETAPPNTAAAPPAPLWATLAAREDDDTTAIALGGAAPVSFAALAGRVAGVAAGLRREGVAPGDRVAVLAPDPGDFIAVAYACWAIGAVTVVVDRGLGVRGLARALRSAEPRWLVGTRKTLADARALRWVPTARRLDIASLAADETRLSAVTEATDPDAAAAVVFTSGATGPAKGVVYSARQMTAQYEAVRSRYAIGVDDRLVAAFAPFALYGPALGIPVAVPDCDITEPATLRAGALAAACAAIDATILFAAPAALDGVTASRGGLSSEGREALGRLRLVLSAGAPVPLRILHAFAGLTPRAELHTPYGMTECLSVTDIELAELDQVGPGKGVCVGQPLASVGVRIEPLAGGDGKTGEIVVSAPWLSGGYDGLWATNRHARTVDDAGARWHQTGDVGHLDSDGRLWVEGRLVHVISAVDGPVTSVPLEVRSSLWSGRAVRSRARLAGCQQVVVVVERGGGPSLRARLSTGTCARRSRRSRSLQSSRSEAPRRSPPQLEDRPRPARPLRRAGARGGRTPRRV